MRYPIRITANPLIGPFLRGFGVRRGNSYVELKGGALTIRMGCWFNETVPLGEIASMAPSEWPWWGGFGVRLAPRQGVAVVASTQGVVNIGLKRPRRMSILIVPRNAENLWVSLEDPDGFLRALSEATGLPISPFVSFWGKALSEATAS